MLSLWSPFCTERKKVSRTSNYLVAVRARSRQLFNHRNNLVASARLALLTSWISFVRSFADAKNCIVVHSYHEYVWLKTFTGKCIIRPNKRHKGKYKIYRVLLSVSLIANDVIHNATNAVCRSLQNRSRWDYFILLYRNIEVRTFEPRWQRNLSYVRVALLGWEGGVVGVYVAFVKCWM